MNTKQFEFDAVVAHLFKQGRPARDHVDAEGWCMYRSPDGLKCAVGCRIPDDKYDPKMENVAVRMLIGKYDLPPEIEAYQHMFDDLQNVHDSTLVINADGTFNTQLLTARLKVVAERFNLTFTLPE